MTLVKREVDSDSSLKDPDDREGGISPKGDVEGDFV